ncbi:lipase/thioesterase family protein [Pochonia chlamydosporia 170]|uniref:Lipase/thioesterase family protein n=1 Tax=Pochonia chlamydosporia 170 TaxID=1380566 RepID=A0A179FB70_METCM|nr:lipase/thioesterase family protein [Pochonia chlamydosporia 170]OAQ62667.1 lipase/thioesterase family protein [Pochonia chlamydosporia 170]
MASTTLYPKPSLGQKLDLLPALGSLVFATFAALATSFRRGPNDEPSLYLHVVYAAVRKLVVRLSAPQLQWVFAHTPTVYKQQAKSYKMDQRTIELNHGGKGHWIGNPDAEHVLIWYHGGGFTLPALEGHLKYFLKLVKSRPSKDLAVFFLSYTLAPTGKYPTQLTQAVEALRYIVTQTQRKPSQVIIGGDSAGGNLVSGVLAHLTHRHHAIEELTLSEPLRAAVLMAPWTALDKNEVKLSSYDGADIITGTALNTWAANYMGGQKPDYYTDASSAPADWFKGLPVSKILVLAGQNETLLPSINEFVKNLEAGYGPVEFYVAEREAHIAPFVNLVFYYGAPTGQGNKLRVWLEDVVAARDEDYDHV